MQSFPLVHCHWHNLISWKIPHFPALSKGIKLSIFKFKVVNIMSKIMCFLRVLRALFGYYNSLKMPSLNVFSLASPRSINAHSVLGWGLSGEKHSSSLGFFPSTLVLPAHMTCFNSFFVSQQESIWSILSRWLKIIILMIDWQNCTAVTVWSRLWVGAYKLTKCQGATFTSSCIVLHPVDEVDLPNVHAWTGCWTARFLYSPISLLPGLVSAVSDSLLLLGFQFSL